MRKVPACLEANCASDGTCLGVPLMAPKLVERSEAHRRYLAARKERTPPPRSPHHRARCDQCRRILDWKTNTVRCPCGKVQHALPANADKPLPPFLETPASKAVLSEALESALPAVGPGERCPISRHPLSEDEGVQSQTQSRCGYFEACVLPLVARRPEYAGAADGYQALPAAMRSARKVRRCECGAPLARRKRFCADCAKRRRREATRRAVRKTRVLCKQLTGVPA